MNANQAISLPSIEGITVRNPQTLTNFKTVPVPVQSLEEDESDDNETDSKVEIYTSFHNSIIHNPQYHTVFNVDFADGYTFRQLFEFSKVSVACAPMFFQSNTIYIERANGSSTLLLRCKINSRDLTSYKVDKTRFNDGARHVIVFDLAEFQLQIKSIAKKEGLRIFQYSEHPEYVFGQPYGGNKNGQGIITFRTQRYESVTYNIKDGITPDVQPNMVIPLPAFCNSCSNVVRAKYPYAIFYVFPEGFYITSGNQTETTRRENNWGNCGQYTDPKDKSAEQLIPFITYVPLDVVRALVKTANFHPSGIVRIYGKTDQLIRIEIPVGCYAEAALLLKGKDPNEIITISRKISKNIK